MKKMTVMVVVLMMTTALSAKSSRAKATEWNGNINVERLSNYLKLTSIQSEDVAMICDFFSREWTKATASKSQQQRRMQKAVYSNLKLMKQTLTREQYSKYMTLINLTLRNNNITIK